MTGGSGHKPAGSFGSASRRAGRFWRQSSRATAVLVGCLWCLSSSFAEAAERSGPVSTDIACPADPTNALGVVQVKRQTLDVSFPCVVVLTNAFAAQSLRFRLICPARPLPVNDPPPEECLLMPEIEMGASKLVITACLKPGEHVELCGDGLLRVFDRDGAQLTAMDPLGTVPELRPGVNRLSLRAQYPLRARLVVVTTDR